MRKASKLRSRTRFLLTGMTVGATAVAVGGLAAGSAGADTAVPIATTYTLTGSTHIRMAHANMTVGGTGTGLETLSIPGDPNFYGGRLTLSPPTGAASTTTLSFTEDGNPVSATVKIAPVGPLTGGVATDGTVTAKSKETLTVTTLTVAGQSVDVGTTCTSIKPFSVNLHSGEGFSLTDGGTMTAKYAIVPFENCGLQGDTVLNGGIPGPGNTASLTLGPATNPVVGPGAVIGGHYPFTGNTTIHRSGAVVTLGPGDLYALPSLNDGVVYGGFLSLPPASGTATINGHQGALTAEFIQQGPISGTISLQTGAVTSTARETLKVTNLTVDGQDIPVPATCQTVKPIVIHAATTAGFSVFGGGPLEAPSYYIPAIDNCGAAQQWVNKALPGPGNKLDLTLGQLSTFP